MVLLSQALAYLDAITRLTDADRTALCDYTGRILRLLEDDSAARCMAVQANGQRCPYRSSNGIHYCKRHSNHGLPLLAHDNTAPAPALAPAQSEPVAPPAPFTLTSADYNKLVEAIAALTGKVYLVLKENQSLKAQAQAGAPRAVPAAPRPPPEAAPCN
eukprot:jgi/Tetstr1/441724/TSEL_029947.t1